MNIVVLDGYTLNPGDLSWADLQALGPCEFHDRTPPDQVTDRASKADILLTNKTVLTRDQILNLPNLKYIGVLATGINVVDLAASRERGIQVTNVPAYGTSSVAQATIALLLELTNHVGLHSRTVHDGQWTRSLDWSYWERPLLELDGLTMGIIGLGRIGTAVANIATALGMNVLASKGNSRLAPFVRLADMDSLFRQSDVLSLHCSLTSEIRHFINSERLSWMKPSAFLLNTSRGMLVDEQALADALNGERLAGAGLDVLSTEPPPADNPLLTAKNCILTPHLAWATKAARSRLMQTALENIRAFLTGKPQNIVD